jgi:hypothetical protein
VSFSDFGNYLTQLTSVQIKQLHSINFRHAKTIEKRGSATVDHHEGPGGLNNKANTSSARGIIHKPDPATQAF